jgi:hypothetical protein
MYKGEIMESDLYYSDYTTTAANSNPEAAMAFLGVVLVIGLILYAVFSFFLGKIFKKAGEDAWKAWVPIYGSWVFLELGGQKGWLALLFLAGLIPFVGWIGSLVATVFLCIAAYHIGKKLQKEDWFVVLYILVSPVWIIWLAMDGSTWEGAAPVAANAAPGYQPPAPSAAPEAPVSQPPVEGPGQNNTPPTTPTV